MNNFPLATNNLFIHKRVKEETDLNRIIDMAEWTARDSGCPENHISSYTTGMLASMLAIVNTKRDAG
jgi:hypothetical protein